MVNIHEIIKKMPKVELHVHLEGAVLPETLLSLAERNKINLPYSDADRLGQWFDFEDFNKFIKVYMTICNCIKTAEDVYTVAEEFFREQHRQNVIYSEITWTPYTHLIQSRLEISEQAEALYAAADGAAKKLGVNGMYVFDIPRQVSASEGLFTAKWLVKHRNREYIAAIGLGGPEVGFPPKRHLRSFKKTGKAGIPAVPHAGETAGPESIRGALELPGSVRIGHGVRAVDDSKLLNELKERGTVLEVCPSSNICLKVFPDMKHHSLPALVDAGLRVTVNSDDPALFGTTLNSEYMLIAKEFGYGAAEFRRFNETAIDAALCCDERRADLRKKFKSGWDAISPAGGRE